MKTTIEIPDALFRTAKARAAHDGLSLRVLFERALSAHLRPGREAEAPGWRKSFGGLKSLKAATREVQSVVDREFSKVDPATWK